jgi:hypothetical protein
MAAGSTLTQAGKDAVETGLPGDKKKKGKKKKKPWLNRKVCLYQLLRCLSCL